MFVTVVEMEVFEYEREPAIVGSAATSAVGPTDDQTCQQQDQNEQAH